MSVRVRERERERERKVMRGGREVMRGDDGLSLHQSLQ